MVIRCRQVNQAGAPQKTVTMRRVNTTMGWVKVLRDCCQLLQSFFSTPQGPVAQHSFNLYTHWPEIYLDHQFYRNLVHNTVLDPFKIVSTRISSVKTIIRMRLCIAWKGRRSHV